MRSDVRFVPKADISGDHLHLRSGRRIAIVDMNIAALRPSKRFQLLLEYFYVWIVKAVP